MAGWDFTDANWLTLAKQYAYQPDSGGAWTDAEWLRFANTVMISVMCPALRKMSAEYYIKTEDVTPVAGQSEYDIPDKALGATVRDIVWIDAPSDVGVSVVWYPLEDRDKFPEDVDPSLAVMGFTIQEDKIVLLSAPQSGDGTLRVRYHRRPNKLVLATSARKVTAVGALSGGNTPLTAASTSGTAFWSDTDTLDIVSGYGSFPVRLEEQGITSIVGVTVTLTGDVTDTVRVNDYLALSGETPIPQIPEVLHGAFARRVAFEALEALGDTRADRVMDVFKLDLTHALTTLSPRNKGEVFRIVNWASHLRGGSSRKYGARAYLR